VRILLKLVSRSGMGGHGLDRSGSGQRQVAGSCVYGDEPSGSLTEDLSSREGLCSMELVMLCYVNCH
jgi:hypothetical protein